MNPSLKKWFARRKWKPFPFQQEAVASRLRGESGLIHAPTGVGKTLAAWLPIVSEWLDRNPLQSDWPRKNEPLRVLWITPLRALAGDTALALELVVDDLKMPWSVEIRTGDTSSVKKAKQRLRFPTTLVTTPESLSLLLSFPETREAFLSLTDVVVDEWHELLSSKRGVQTELALARLRQWSPGLRTWGLSATLGNLQEAMQTLLGVGNGASTGKLISAEIPKDIRVETILPASIEKFPWVGHLGLRLLPEVIEAVEKARTTLIFTNVRSQTEIWYQAILGAKPEWENSIGIHHGSIDRKTREAAEQGLRNGTLRAVVCTSSLDLGVDFSPVDQVLQIGGPKGIARLLQRAGRSGHRPGGHSRVLCVPTHALELVEYSAARKGLERREVESRMPRNLPLDVLSQHLVTIALGGGFRPDDLFQEVKTSHAYQNLTREAFDWVLQFVMKGGKSLRAYPEFCRVVEEDGICKVTSREISRFHRLSIGTITSEVSVQVQFMRGKKLGSVEESFIARVKPGGCFVFAGRLLQLVKVYQMTAYVRPGKKGNASIPIWDGGRLPLSTLLAKQVREELSLVRTVLDEKQAGKPIDLERLSPEMKRVLPTLEIQSAWSCIPRPDQLLVETATTREGTHWFLFPFGGRLAHEGLAALLAYRLSRRQPATVTITINDYGLELLPAQKIEVNEEQWRQLLSPENLLDDLLACLNASELARRQFREIARIAGLVFQGYPGANKSARQVQASSSLFYEVFLKYEPEHLLLDQARREVLEQQLEISRLRSLLERIYTHEIILTRPPRLTPLAFPLWADFIRGQVSSENWSDRVRRMAEKLEREAAEEVGIIAA